MTTKLWITAFIIGFTGLAQNAGANTELPAIQFDCSSKPPEAPLSVRGTFQEEVNRHGAGQIDFTVSTTTFSLQKSGEGHTPSADEISYSDDSIGLELSNANYDSNSISTFRMDGQSIPMKCKFTSPTVPQCNQWFCHHNSH